MGILQLPPSVRPSRYLLLNHWMKSNQIWCVSCSHKWGTQRHFFSPAPWGPGEGQKGQISWNFIHKVNFIFFKPNVVCFLTNERYKTYHTGFSFGRLGHAPGFGTWGAGGSKFNFLNMIMWHIKLKGMSSKPGYTEQFYPTIKLVTLGWCQIV